MSDQDNVREIVTDWRKLVVPCEEFSFSNPVVDPEKISLELVNTCRSKNGVGLAANQIGYDTRVIAVLGDGTDFVMFNPVIVHSEGEQTLDEACLSFPGVIVPIKRALSVRVRFKAPNGETFTKKFNGLTARIIQHEIDHLDGILFYNKTDRYHRDKALKKLRK